MEIFAFDTHLQFWVWVARVTAPRDTIYMYSMNGTHWDCAAKQWPCEAESIYNLFGSGHQTKTVTFSQLSL